MRHKYAIHSNIRREAGIGIYPASTRTQTLKWAKWPNQDAKNIDPEETQHQNSIHESHPQIGLILLCKKRSRISI